MGEKDLADFALTPIKPIPSKQYSTPVKDGEYWALGLPVIITPNISDDSEIIEAKGIGAIISTLDEAGYKKAVEQMDQLLSSTPRAELHDRIREVAVEHRSFAIAGKVYTTIYG